MIDPDRIGDLQTLVREEITVDLPDTDAVIKALNDSYAFLYTEVAKMSDADLDKMIKLFGNDATVRPDRFAGQVKVEAGAAKKYYDGNPSEFRIPEQVRVEYLVLSISSLMEEIRPDPEEVPDAPWRRHDFAPPANPAFA